MKAVAGQRVAEEGGAGVLDRRHARNDPYKTFFGPYAFLHAVDYHIIHLFLTLLIVRERAVCAVLLICPCHVPKEFCVVGRCRFYKIDERGESFSV